MGVCQDCLVTIDGTPDQRACMTPVHDGMRIEQNPSRRSLDASASATIGSNSDDFEVIRPQVLVIGGGPGGLTAAAVAAELGAKVVLLDERTSVGGQFYKQVKSPGRVLSSLAGDSQFADGRRLIDRARQSGATLISNAEVWGAFDGRELTVSEDGATRIYRPERIIVATGAYERGLPVPGWTLPGVMTTGAAQTLLRSHGTVPGGRVLIAGNGPLNFQVALELCRAGAKVVALAELARAAGLSGLPQAMRMFTAAPDLTLKGLGILAGLRNARVPLRYNSRVAAIESGDSPKDGLKVSLASVDSGQPETTHVLEVDAVCMGYGFLPNNELLRLLGCRHRFDRQNGHLVTERSVDCETSVKGIFAVGDCCGLGGAPAAMQEAVIAAIATARSLGLTVSKSAIKQLRRARGALRRQRRFQSALWELYSAPRFDVQFANDDTPVCRCENVTMRSLNEAVANGHRSLAQIKRHTRLGMGSCQGRYCAPLALSMLLRQHAVEADELSMFAPRVPVRPISVQKLLNKNSS